MRKIRKLAMVFMFVTALILGTVQMSAKVFAEDTVTYQRIEGAPNNLALINGEKAAIFCMQFDNLWPTDSSPGMANAPTKYVPANPEELYLTEAQVAVVQRVLYAGYPYNAEGILEDIYKLYGLTWGMEFADDIAATLTQDVIWSLMAEWGVPGNTKYNTQEREYGALEGYDEAYAALMAFGTNGTITPLPSSDFELTLDGDLEFKEDGDVFVTGNVEIADPNGYKLMYEVVFPQGVIPVDENGGEIASTSVYENGDFVEKYYFFGSEPFRLQTEDITTVEGKVVSITGEAKAPTNVTQLMTTDTGLGVKNGVSAQYPYQNMLTVGIDTVSLAGSVTLSAPTEETTEIYVGKEWFDGDNADGNRPTSVKICLVVNDEVQSDKFVTLGAGNRWLDKFEDLPVNDADGQPITYSVEEVEVEGYKSEVTKVSDTRFTVTNTQVIDVTGTKTWAEDTESVRPDSITVRLLANDEEKDRTEVSPTADGQWTYKFEDLPKYDADGTEIVYSVEEDEVENYEAEYDGYNIKNTFTPETTEIYVTKEWLDGDNADGNRPTSVKICLVVNDEVQSDRFVTLGAGNRWLDKFEDLPVIDKEGQPITYSVEEVEVEGYKSEVTKVSDTRFTITNTQVIDITGTKTWGNDNRFKRPQSITIHLFANGEEVDSVDVTADDDWKWVFEGLDKYKDGEAIEYTITEDKVEGYTTTISGSAEEGFKVRNIFNKKPNDEPNKENKTHDKTPDTSDRSNINLYTLMMAISALGIAVCAIIDKRKKNLKNR